MLVLACDPISNSYSNISDFARQLRERNIWRAFVAYPAAGFVFLEVVEFFVSNYQLNAKFLTVALIFIVGALPIALIWNWCHGQAGTQAIGTREGWSYALMIGLSLTGGGWYWVATADPSRAGRIDLSPSADMSIAVLPFESINGGSELDYLCDGIAESLINTLSAIPDLKVISRLSAFALRDRTGHPQEVGSRLGVGRMLAGQLERRGDNLVIRVTLVDTHDGRELWGDRFVRPMAEILELEDMITTDIATALRLELPTRPASSSSRGGVDPTAYRNYLQGRFLVHASTADEIDLGLTHLRETTRLEPSFAPAYATIADAMIVKAFFSMSPSAEIIGEARTAAQSAIALNPDLAEAYAALASIRMFFDFDWPGSEDAFRKAISLGPTSSPAYYRYASLLTGLGRFDEAVRMAERAVEIDPIAIGALHALGLAKLFGGDFEGAAAAFGNAIEIHPDWTWGYVKKSLAHALNGEDAEALALAEQTEQLTGGWGSAFLQGWLAWVYSVTEQDELLQRVADRINQGIEDNRIEDPFGVALTYFATGEFSLALDWAEKTVNERSPNAVFWSVGTADHLQLVPAAVRENPRFIELLRRLGLPEH
jgi:TolB-like protein/tetratricopeptide (TPR) repeat protein